MATGKLEALITIPSGGYTISVTDSGGTDAAITLSAANTYYWSTAGNDSNDLPAALAALLNASGTLNGTYTVTVDASDGGTGKLTIACNESFTATWTDTDFRDLCGFDGNISSTTSATGADHVHSLWLPQCPTETLFGASDEGFYESDGVTTTAPTGASLSTLYNVRTVNQLAWTMATENKARTAAESTTNESFQTFVSQAAWGQSGWAAAGGPVRWHPDADVDGTYTEYHFVMAPTIDITRAIEGFHGYYRISTPRLMKVP